MKSAIVILVLAAVAFTSACGAHPWRTSDDLWDDVPRMEGLTQAGISMPEEAIQVIRPVLRIAQKWRMTVVAFTTEKSPQVLRDFYITEGMARMGWTLENEPGCSIVKRSVVPSLGEGIVCLFSREQDGERTMLNVVAIRHDKWSKTNVYFARINDW